MTPSIPDAVEVVVVFVFVVVVVVDVVVVIDVDVVPSVKYDIFYFGRDLKSGKGPGPGIHK